MGWASGICTILQVRLRYLATAYPFRRPCLFPPPSWELECFSKCLIYHCEFVPAHRTGPREECLQRSDDHWVPVLSPLFVGSSASPFENSNVTSPSSTATILTESKSLTIQSGSAALTCSAV